MAKGNDFRREAAKLFDQLVLPTYDYSEITPEQYSVVGTYDPFVGEEAVLSYGDMNESRAAQVRALEALKQIGRDGLTLDERLASQGIEDAVMEGFGRQDDAIKQDLARRGMLGGGTEIMMRQAAGQRDANMARRMADDAKRTAMARSLEAIKASGSLGSTMRSQDMSVENMRTNLFNQFQARQADIKNRAAQYNAGVQQNVANANVADRNAFRINERNRKDDLASQEFSNERALLSDKANALNNQATGADAADAARAANKAAKDAQMLNYIGTGVDIASKAPDIIDGIGKVAEWL